MTRITYDTSKKEETLMTTKERPKKYTLIFHRYIGYGGYTVDFERVRCKKLDLEQYKQDSLHFIIPGWPPVSYTDGSSVYEHHPVVNMT